MGAGLPVAVIGIVTQWRSILDAWPPPVFRPWPTHLSGVWEGVGFPHPWEETGDGTRPVMNSSPIWYPVDRGIPHPLSRKKTIRYLEKIHFSQGLQRRVEVQSILKLELGTILKLEVQTILKLHPFGGVSRSQD